MARVLACFVRAWNISFAVYTKVIRIVPDMALNKMTLTLIAQP